MTARSPLPRACGGFGFGEGTFAGVSGNDEDAPKVVAGTRVDLRNPNFEWRAGRCTAAYARGAATEAAWMPVLSRIRASHGGLNYASNRAGLWPP
jgi:hypothetical protein